MKDALHYFKLANSKVERGLRARKLSVRLITNFTDTTLQKILTGVCIESGINPTIIPAPYKQYHLLFKNTKRVQKADITFIFFDVHNYGQSAFHSDEAHFDEILADLEQFCAREPRPIVMSTFPTPFEGAYGNLFSESPLFKQVREANTKLQRLATKISNLYLFDVSKALHAYGEQRARDFRGMYSVDIPFTNDFFVALSQEWLGYIKASVGLSKKCLVLDLDNTLWGGIVGEAGARGIALGPDYPGLAYQSFQRVLLEFYNRGVILAINSRNNPGDVDEVFKTNPHMILRPEHFSAVRINWNNKAENLVELAQELNIGTESMVFIDDDAMNRDLVRTRLPEVLVPEWSIPPEQYIPALLSVKDFYQFQLTEEDRKKGAMYAQERQRRVVHASMQNIDDYIAALKIKLTMHTNDAALIPRISQMTLKTNQFNITTKRYSEKDIASFIKKGAWVIAAEVSDKFGDYGTTILAIITHNDTRAVLDTYLMSCRIMGRGIEQTFMDHCFRMLKKRGITEVTAAFIPTSKNMPAKDFLPSVGFSKAKSGAYTLSIAKYMKELARRKSSITVVS